MHGDGLIQRTFREDVRALAAEIRELSSVVDMDYITPVTSIIDIFNTLAIDIYKVDLRSEWKAIVDMMSSLKSSFSELKTSIFTTHPLLCPIISVFEKAIIITNSATFDIREVSKRCEFMVNIFNKIGLELYRINAANGFQFLGKDVSHVMVSIIAKSRFMQVYRIEPGHIPLEVEWKAIDKLADLLSSIIKRGQSRGDASSL